MKRNVVVILGLCAFLSSGCGREASKRWRINKFVRTTESPAHTGPPSVAAPALRSGEFDLSSDSSSGASRARRATAAHGPSANIRLQMLGIKEENARASVIDDVKTALKEGTTSELVQLTSAGARAFSGWITSLERGEYQRSRIRLSRDAQFDRVERSGDSRVKIRRYEISFGGPVFAGWIEVKLSNSRWIIVDAVGYAPLHDPTEESDSVLDWISE